MRLFGQRERDREPPLQAARQAAAQRVARELGGTAASVVEVSPEAWRRELLLPKERKSGVQAKSAARLVARQVVSDLGCAELAPLEGAFPTDAAEAVCAGYFACRSLGWKAASDRPAVRRYQNGAVVKSGA